MGSWGGDGSNDGVTVSLNRRRWIPKCDPRLNHACLRAIFSMRGRRRIAHRLIEECSSDNANLCIRSGQKLMQINRLKKRHTDLARARVH